jgi:hypothetical protein
METSKADLAGLKSPGVGLGVSWRCAVDLEEEDGLGCRRVVAQREL